MPHQASTQVQPMAARVRVHAPAGVAWIRAGSTIGLAANVGPAQDLADRGYKVLLRGGLATQRRRLALVAAIPRRNPPAGSCQPVQDRTATFPRAIRAR